MGRAAGLDGDPDQDYCFIDQFTTLGLAHEFANQ